MAGGQKGRVGGALTHGEGKNGQRSKEFRTWLSMRLRCRQKPEYRDRGITVCVQWSNSFTQFLLDVGRAPSDTHTLDRWPDPDGDYEPNNVRWATKVEQRHNRRTTAKVGRHWSGRHRNLPHRTDGTFAPKRFATDYQETR